MAKTIFNTTEKSNFILNMKTTDYQKFLLRILLGLAVLMPVFCFPLEFAKVYTAPGMALSIIGVFAMVFVLIGFMKKVTPKHLYLPAALFGGMVIWSIVSLFNSYFYNVSLMGADGRNEGVLSVVFYGCLFLLGAQLGTDSNVQKLLHGLLWMGLAECVWALFQALPLGLPSYYENLEPMLLFRCFLPSGLAGSPIFFAILLNMLAFPAMLGAVFAEKKKQRLFYLICAAVFVLMSVRTQCLIGMITPAVSILACLICALVKRSGKKLLPVLGAVLAAAAIGLIWVYFAPAMNGTFTRGTGEDVPAANGIAVYDGGIFWDDSSYRLAASGYYVPEPPDNPDKAFEVSDVAESYGYLWKNTLSVIQDYPFVGTGPDNLVYSQMYQSHDIMSNPNAFDRCYNYYLHLAATQGIPALLLFVVLMVTVLWQGMKSCKGSNWLTLGILGAVVLYLLMMVIGTTSVTVTPFFWMLAGCLCRGKTK